MLDSVEDGSVYTRTLCLPLSACTLSCNRLATFVPIPFVPFFAPPLSFSYLLSPVLSIIIHALQFSLLNPKFRLNLLDLIVSRGYLNYSIISNLRTSSFNRGSH